MSAPFTWSLKKRESEEEKDPTKKYRGERKLKQDEIFRLVILICYIVVLVFTATMLIYLLATRHYWSNFREILDESAILHIEAIIAASACAFFVCAIVLAIIARCRGRGAAIAILVLSCLILAGIIISFICIFVMISRFHKNLVHVLMESLGAYNEELADKGLEYTWNIVQIRLNACGVTKAQEWEKSKWAKSDHATPAGTDRNYPLSCCTNIFESDLVALAKNKDDKAVNQKMEECYTNNNIYSSGAVEKLRSMFSKPLSKDFYGAILGLCLVFSLAATILSVFVYLESARKDPRGSKRHTNRTSEEVKLTLWSENGPANKKS